ncbi:MAG: M20 metallopeptidase family protein [Brevinema sp.]
MFPQEIKDLHPWLVAVRRDFHENPELGFEEFRTSDKIKEYLTEMGLSPKSIAQTGVIAEITGQDPSRTIAIRADIDALPIHDSKDCPYRSKIDGKMHACGHDAHTTIALGVAKILSQNTPPCNVRFLFQPAEETDGGAVPIINEGGLDHVNAIFGLHVDSELPVGQIACRYGAMNASSDMITIELFGKKSHAAYPAGSVDAIVIAAAVIQNLQSIISRNIDGRESAVLSLGMIHGGTARNVIADHVVIEGTIRTLNPEIREHVNKRVKEMLDLTAKAFGGSAKYTRKLGYTSLINHDKAVDHIIENAKTLLGAQNVIMKPHPNMGVEDFAYYLEKVEGAFFYLGTANYDKGIVHHGHNEGFDIDEDALAIGVQMQLANIFSYHQYLSK